SAAAKEIRDGKITEFTTKDHPKSKGAVFTIKFPASWAAKEGERANVVQKFVSENGHGTALAMILTKTMPAQYPVTKTLINEMFSPEGLKEMLLPKGARLIRAQTTKIEGEPAGLLEYSSHMEQAGQEIETHTLMLVFFQGQTMVSIQFGLSGQSQPNELQKQFGAYRPLFNMIMNSIVFDDKWR
ncbi:MAG: hypothetical protein MOB07_16980, partial [Acidobacteria bacterium]|nr:hypothetical protein [Acidobacteriota bacterium]